MYLQSWQVSVIELRENWVWRRGSGCYGQTLVMLSQCWMMSCFLGNWYCAMETWAGKECGGNKSGFNSHWVIFPPVSPFSLCPVHCPHSISGYPWEHKQTAQHPSLNLLPQYEKPAAQDTTWNKIDEIIMCVHPSHWKTSSSITVSAVIVLSLGETVALF